MDIADGGDEQTNEQKMLLARTLSEEEEPLDVIAIKTDKTTPKQTAATPKQKIHRSKEFIRKRKVKLLFAPPPIQINRKNISSKILTMTWNQKRNDSKLSV